MSVEPLLKLAILVICCGGLFYANKATILRPWYRFRLRRRIVDIDRYDFVPHLVKGTPGSYRKKLDKIGQSGKLRFANWNHGYLVSLSPGSIGEPGSLRVHEDDVEQLLQLLK